MANLASATDPDLEAAAADIQRVADHINEMKRRKDMAEMILTGKPDQTSVGKTPILFSSNVSSLTSLCYFLMIWVIADGVSLFFIVSSSNCLSSCAFF